MKSVFWLLLFSFSQCYAIAQFRTLNGDIICRNCSTDTINDRYGYKFTGTAFLKTGVVIYEKLSGRPLFLDVATKGRVPVLLNEFKAHKYKGSLLFFDDLESMITNGTLTDLYLIEKFGSPEEVAELLEEGKRFRILKYPGAGFAVYVSGRHVVRYTRVKM